LSSRYFIVLPRSMLAVPRAPQVIDRFAQAALRGVAHSAAAPRRYFIVVPSRCPRRRSLRVAGT
jgi:hypothetical protein